jgi:putative membrane protein
MNPQDLPLINASLNGLATVLLLLGYRFIKTGRKVAHRNCMIAAFAVSSAFLVGYVYHKVFVVRGVNTPFRGPAALKLPYLILLFSHVTLAMAVVPMILVSLKRGLDERYEMHRQIARWTWPIWLYVSVTGVVVYLVLYVIWPG